MRFPFLFSAAIAALLAITLGAFGAHGLQSILTVKMLAVYKTAVTYQMWHALGLGIISLLIQQSPDSKLLSWAGRLMITGIFLFSGSLYLLSLLDLKWLGMITPFGGIAFITSWVLLAIYAAQKDSSS